MGRDGHTPTSCDINPITVLRVVKNPNSTNQLTGGVYIILCKKGVSDNNILVTFIFWLDAYTVAFLVVYYVENEPAEKNKKGCSVLSA